MSALSNPENSSFKNSNLDYAEYVGKLKSMKRGIVLINFIINSCNNKSTYDYLIKYLQKDKLLDHFVEFKIINLEEGGLGTTGIEVKEKLNTTDWPSVGAYLAPIFVNILKSEVFHVGVWVGEVTRTKKTTESYVEHKIKPLIKFLELFDIVQCSDVCAKSWISNSQVGSVFFNIAKTSSIDEFDEKATIHIDKYVDKSATNTGDGNLQYGSKGIQKSK
jgi:hypothetical protein